jgi:hypothetical protein
MRDLHLHHLQLTSTAECANRIVYFLLVMLQPVLLLITVSLAGVQKMYVTMFPCNECSKLLIQAGIREVIFYEDKSAPVKFSSPNEAPGTEIR